MLKHINHRSSDSGGQQRIVAEKNVKDCMEILESGRTQAEQIDGVAIWLALLFGAVQTVIVFVAYSSTVEMPLVGDVDSVGVYAFASSILAALVVTPIMYMLGGRLRNKALPSRRRHNYVWSVVPITLAVTLLVLRILGAVFQVLDGVFVGVALHRIAAAMSLGMLVGFLAYILAIIAARLQASGLLYIVMIYLFGTLIMATVGQNNIHWWQRSFSYLGMSDSNSSVIFDLGLIFTAILILIWQQFFMDEFAILVEHGLVTSRSARIVRGAFILMGILLAGVGIFRFGMTPLFNVIHDISASGGIFIIAILMVAIHWLNPHYIRAFYVISIVLVLLLVVVGGLKVVGLVNLVGLELLGFVMAGAWMLLFAHHTDLLIHNHSLVTASYPETPEHEIEAAKESAT